MTALQRQQFAVLADTLSRVRVLSVKVAGITIAPEVSNTTDKPFARKTLAYEIIRSDQHNRSLAIAIVVVPAIAAAIDAQPTGSTVTDQMIEDALVAIWTVFATAA